MRADRDPDCMYRDKRPTDKPTFEKRLRRKSFDHRCARVARMALPAAFWRSFLSALVWRARGPTAIVDRPDKPARFFASWLLAAPSRYACSVRRAR